MSKQRGKASQQNQAEQQEQASQQETEWELASGFKTSWQQYKNDTLTTAMTTFNNCKRANPPQQLPAKMNEHKLDGPLKGYMECHLDDDVLLIYKPLPKGAYKLLRV